MDGLFSRGELTRWRRVVRFRLFVFGRPPSERRRKRLAGQPGLTQGGRRRSGAIARAAWLCGVRRGLRRGRPSGAALSWETSRGFAAPPAPHRPQTLPARLCEAARPAPRPMYGRERRRARAPSEGHFPARSARGAGAREWSGCASLRVAALGLRALSREASRGFAPQSRGGDAQPWEAARGGRCKRAKIWNCQNKRSMVSLVSSYKPSVTALHKRIATVDSPQK